MVAGGWENSQLTIAGGGGAVARAGMLPAPNRNRLCSGKSVLMQTSLRRWFKWFRGRVVRVRDKAVTPGVGELPCC